MTASNSRGLTRSVITPEANVPTRLNSARLAANEDAVPPPMWHPSMYATRWVSVTPVEVTPQTKNGIESSQKSPTRITWRIGGGLLRVTGALTLGRRNQSTPTRATAISAASSTSAASSEISSASREVGSMTIAPAAVAAPTTPNSVP